MITSQKQTGSYFKSYRDETVLNDGAIIDFPENNTAYSFKSKTDQTGNKKCWNNGTIKITK